jgi:predicted RNase H-like HicB family nuclease
MRVKCGKEDRFMSQIHHAAGAASSLWVLVRPEPAGQFTARVVGLPELQATAATREQAVQHIRDTLDEWIASGQLVALPIPRPHPLQGFSGWIDPNNPLEQEFLQELARQKAEDLERTLQEYEQEDRECSNSSSTPTT